LIVSKNPNGVNERIKIVNSNKIPCKVSIKIENKEKDNVFSIEPNNLVINPHEFSYVKMLFNPSNMQLYNGIFEAIVTDGDKNPENHKLKFNLKGVGTYPTITILEPTLFNVNNKLFIEFGKVRVKKSLNKKIKIKNNGKIDSTCRIEVTGNMNFNMRCDNTQPTLKPLEEFEFDAIFNPKSIGTFVHEIHLKTLLNPFEHTIIELKGEAFEDEILFDNLPNNSEDSLEFGDCWNNYEKIHTFIMINKSKDWIKFTWPNKDTPNYNETLTFKPSIGFIEPFSSKQISCKFLSHNTINLNNFNSTLSTIKIGDVKKDWDNSMITLKYISQAELEWIKKKQEEAINIAKQQKGKKVVEKVEEKPNFDNEPQTIEYEEVQPEPEHKVIENSTRNLNLYINSKSDEPKLVTNLSNIKFRPTMM